jgi:membrane protease YdiL (CAAX protease family)
MTINKKYIPVIEAILCCFAFMVFAFFINAKLPFRLVAVTALFLPAWFFGRNLQSLSDLRKITGESASLKITILYIITGILVGTLFTILYRWHLEISLFPKSINFFVLVAALIGCTEELVFRGFIQEYVKSVNAPFSILFSTISHTFYKCCLFMSPMVNNDINIGFLAFWTLIAGILLGTIKHITKSILPSMIAHALFDVLVYAEFVRAPWWVW